MRERNAETLKRLRANAAARGLCYMCRCRFPRPGVRNCDECLRRVYERRKFGKGLEAQRRHGRKRNARRSSERKVAGLCRCGRRPPLSGYASCSVCLDYTAAKTRQYLRTKLDAKTEPPCSICGRPGHNSRRHKRPGVLP